MKLFRTQLNKTTYIDLFYSFLEPFVGQCKVQRSVKRWTERPLTKQRQHIQKVPDGCPAGSQCARDSVYPMHKMPSFCAWTMRKTVWRTTMQHLRGHWDWVVDYLCAGWQLCSLELFSAFLWIIYITNVPLNYLHYKWEKLLYFVEVIDLKKTIKCPQVCSSTFVHFT